MSGGTAVGASGGEASSTEASDGSLNTREMPPENASNSLLKLLEDQIKSSGPIPIPLYMNLCASHPTLGYYARRRPDGSDPFGTRGDFVTSPEVSQVFGEILAIWMISRWEAAGKPQRTRIVELGPGRATLMADMIRTFASIKEFAPSLGSVHLVETSEVLREQQRKKLLDEMKLPDLECPVEWHGRIEDVSISGSEWTMVIAHEFFDALPIHIFENTARGFREVLVGLAPETSIVSPTPRAPLCYVLAPQPTLASTSLLSPTPGFQHSVDRFNGLPHGSRIEVSPASTTIAGQLARMVGREDSGGGAGLIVDYGDDRWFGNSFRGFRRHQIADPLTEPGLTDLTANVDFSSLRLAMAPRVGIYGPLNQHTFLTSLGLPLRLAMLQKAAASEDRKRAIAHAGERLVALTGMGQQYKVMGFENRRLGAQPGEPRDAFPFTVTK